MLNLKNLNISESELEKCKNLAVEPAFAVALKKIDDFIEQIKKGQSNNTNCKVTVGEDTVAVDVAYSVFNEDVSIDKNNRVIKSFNMSLDDDKNFVMLVSGGSFSRKKNPYAQIGDKKTYDNIVIGNYNYERTTVKKDSETVIAREFVSSALDDESNELNGTSIPFNTLCSFEYEISDNELKKQVDARIPRMNKGLISFDSRRFNASERYSAYSAVRSDDSSHVTIREFVHYPDNLEIDTVAVDGNFVNMSSPDAMRIDSPYGMKMYTVEKMDNIRQKKDVLNEDFTDDQEYGSVKSH